MYSLPIKVNFFHRNTIDMKTVIVPGDKKSKYKRERDLIGLSGDTHLCLFTAEADVEEDEVRMGAKMMRSVGAFNVNTNLLDGHLYIMRRWVCDYIISDRNISTIKGELLPIIVKKQFSRPSGNKEEMQEKRTIQSFVETGHKLGSDRDKTLYSCHAYITESPCYRVNTMPAYWHCNSVLRYGQTRNIWLDIYLLKFIYSNYSKRDPHPKIPAHCHVLYLCEV